MVASFLGSQHTFCFLQVLEQLGLMIIVKVMMAVSSDNQSDYKEMMAMILTITSSSFEQKRTPLERLAAAMLTMVGGETRRDSI